MSKSKSTLYPRLVQVEGKKFVLIRDQSPTDDEAVVNEALYAEVDESGKILQDRQYSPNARSKPTQIVGMNPSPWSTNEELKEAGVPGYVLPKEPVLFEED